MQRLFKQKGKFEMTKELKVFGVEIEFEEDEVLFFQEVDFDLEKDFVEFVLRNVGVSNFEGLNKEEAKLLCINGIKKYTEDTLKALEISENEGIV